MGGVYVKAIATVNFKGGVGKTTISWLLAKYAAEQRNKKVLVVDVDAQMSLTLAVQLQENGAMFGEFEKWYDNHRKKTKSSMFDAIQQYDDYANGRTKHFDFPINGNVVYQMSENLHFIPSTVELYWLELDVFDKVALKDFIKTFLGKIEHTKNMPKYDYVFFDCPPNFTAISYSVLSCSSLILIPVNPDVFASRGIELMLDGLENRIQPWPNPRISVFMNKAKTRLGDLTRETKQYWELSKIECTKKSQKGMKISTFESYIPDRVDIKRAIPGKNFPTDFVNNFSSLWTNVEGVLRA